MAVDKGPLHYSIEVEDGFSLTTIRFVEEMRRSADAFKQFKRELTGFSSSASGLKDLAAAAAEARKGQAAAGRSARQTAEDLSIEEKATRRVAKATEELAIRQELAARHFGNQGVGEFTESDKQAAAIDKVIKAKNKLLVIDELLAKGFDKQGNAQKTIQQLGEELFARREQARAIKNVADLLEGQTNDLLKNKIVVEQQIDNLGNLKNALDQTGESTSSLSGAFQRLITAFLFFQTARAVVGGFKSLVAESIAFNAGIERSTLGIASLLTAVGDVRDATGGTVTASRALALSQGEAAKQAGLLRKAALDTGASFEDLVETFQNGLAPGLRAGLNVDQIRQFTVQISQAAASIGLQQTQLAEEIRSILSGTIQSRTTRIATALGITNEDIRLAKEAGTLFDLLNTKFRAFSAATAEAAGNFDVLFHNATDSLKQLLGAGSTEFFNELKSLFREIVAITTTRTKDGLLEPRPEALLVVRAFAASLADAVREAQAIVATLDFKTIAADASLVGSALSQAAQFVSAIVIGFARGLRDVALVVSVAAEKFSGLTITPATLARVAELFVIFKALSLVVNALAFGPVALLVKGGIAIRTNATAIKAAFVAWGAPLLAALVAVTAVAFAIDRISTSSADAGQTFGQGLLIALKQLKNDFLDFVGEIASNSSSLFDAVVGSFVKAMLVVFASLADGVATLLEKVPESISARAAVAAKSAREAAKSARETLEAHEQSRKLAQEEFDLGLAQQKAERDAALQAEADANQARNKADPKFGKSLFGGVQEQIEKELLGLDFAQSLKLPEAKQQARDLVSAIDSLPPAIGQSGTAFEHQAELTKGIREDLERARAELVLGLEAINAQGAALSEHKTLREAEIQFQEKSKALTTEITQAEEILASASASRLQALRQQSALSTDEVGIVGFSVTLARERLDLQNQLTAAKARGDLQAVASIQTQLDSQKQLTEQVFAGTDPARQQVLLGIVQQRLASEGQIVVAQERVNALKAEETELAQRTQAAAAAKLQLAAAQASADLRRQNAELRIQALEQNGGPLAALQAKIKLISEETRFNVEALRAIDAKLIAQEQSLLAELAATQSLEKQVELQRQLAGLTGARAKVEEQISLTLENAELRRQAAVPQTQTDINKIGQNTIPGGIASGAESASFGNQLPTFFGDLLQTVEPFTQQISDLVRDALDPTEPRKQIKQRFQDLLKQLAISAGLNLLGGLLGVPGLGSIASAGASGFATGGEVGSAPRRPGSTDTVPAMLTPREWVMRVSAVHRYGSDVMAKLNAGVIDPAGLRALARGTSPIAVRSPARPHFSEGGLVPDRYAAQQQVAVVQQQVPSGPSIAFVVPNEQSLERQLAAGSPAMLRFLKQHAATISTFMNGARK